jgi:hypothetical protein
MASNGPVIDWLYNSAPSQFIQNTPVIIPSVQAVHILAVSVVIGSSLVLCLRQFGVIATEQTGVLVARRFVPWIWGALALLVVTGATLVVGEPERVLANPVFWIKMTLLATEVAVSLRLGKLLARAEDDQALRRARPWGAIALLLWAAIITAGRWIAYFM